MSYHLKKLPGKRTGMAPGSVGFPPNALLDKVDSFFFFGDLNYRVELPREQVSYVFSPSTGHTLGGAVVAQGDVRPWVGCFSSDM